MQNRFVRFVPHKDIELFNSGDARRAGLVFGCQYLSEVSLYRFMLWAPNALSVSLCGSFNGWDNEGLSMERIHGGFWICFTAKVQEGDEYMFCVTGCDGQRRMKADPFARSAQCSGIMASLVCTRQDYVWKDGEYMRRLAERDVAKEAISVYEVHAGSWKSFAPDRAAYRALGDALAEYCVEMGYTHVELLPITEHPFYGSWGYQVTGYFAPTSRYGTVEDFKYFVDRLHSAGIGIILDWVPAHFPRDSYGLAEFDGTPLFERKDPELALHPQWGSLIFDYSSAQVQSFLVSSACMFLEEYHVDGIRVDAVSSMLHLNFGRKYGLYGGEEDMSDIDRSALEFLRKLNRTIHGLRPSALTVAEESGDYPGVTAALEKGGLGFDLKWDMGYMHDTLDYMSAPSYMRRKMHNRLSFSMMYAFNERYVLAYSHDEVVYGKRAMLEKMAGDYSQKLASLRTLYTYQYAHPGKKLCFMGNEFAQLDEWDHDKKLDWLLLDYPAHEGLRQLCRELNSLYRSCSALYRADDSWDGFEWLNVSESEKCAIAFMRSSPEDKSEIVCACNFSAVPIDNFVIALPAAGMLEEIFSSEDKRFGGNGILNKKNIHSIEKNFLNFPFSAELSLAPLSAVMFRFIRKE